MRNNQTELKTCWRNEN